MENVEWRMVLAVTGLMAAFFGDEEGEDLVQECQSRFDDVRSQQAAGSKIPAL